jgi:putative hydrolases of HD superfamily
MDSPCRRRRGGVTAAPIWWDGRVHCHAYQQSSPEFTLAEFANSTLTLFESILRLKRLPRTGWLLAGVALPESVADHTFGTALMACLVGELVNAGLDDVDIGRPIDLGRVARMALIHDLAESLVTDLPRQATDIIGRDTKHAAEYDAIREMLTGVTGGDYFESLWIEYENGTTPEARLVQDADKLDMVLQAQHYASAGNMNLAEFWRDHSWNYSVSRVLFDKLRA